MNHKIIQEYLDAGARLTLLQKNGKKPIIPDWPNKKVSDARVLSHNGNIGMKLGRGVMCFDVDPKNGGFESFPRLMHNLGIKILPTVRTPSGGWHAYLAVPYPSDRRYKTNLDAYPGVDLLGKGKQCVIVSSVTKDGVYRWADPDLGGFDLVDAPLELLEAFDRGTENVTGGNSHLAPPTEDLGDFEGLLGPRDKMSRERVEEVLGRLDPGMTNDEWVRVGMALKDWDSVEGLELWEEWSKGGDSYEVGECEKRWRSFDDEAGEGGVTMGTLIHMADDAGGSGPDPEQVIALFDNYQKLIVKASEQDLLQDICPAIVKEHFNGITLNKIVVLIQARLTALSDGIKPPIGECRKMVAGAAGLLISDGKPPPWCNNWVFVNSINTYVDFKYMESHSRESFNLINTNKLRMIDGTTMTASQYATLTGHIIVVNGIGYLPMHAGERIVKIDGKTMVNSFSPRTVPEAADVYTKSGKKAIRRIIRHLRLLCGSKENWITFKQWLAHQVQHPGELILWSPLFQGIEGIGKSFILVLLKAVLGDVNVGVVTPQQVISQFNGWAVGRCVNVLEELKLTGHNRYDAVNALKPLVTDRSIQINEKGVNSYMTLNTANYICFTNWKDALPLGETDRRWWVIQILFRSLAEFEVAVGENLSEYFPALFDGVREHGTEIRKWLLDIEITDEFRNTNQAPMTDFKKMMIATEEESLTGLAEVREMVAAGGLYYNSEVVSLPDLFADMLFEHPEMEIIGKSRVFIMKKMGYQQNIGTIKLGGRTRRMWVQRPMSAAEIRASLKKKG